MAQSGALPISQHPPAASEQGRTPQATALSPDPDSRYDQRPGPLSVQAVPGVPKRVAKVRDSLRPPRTDSDENPENTGIWRPSWSAIDRRNGMTREGVGGSNPSRPTSSLQGDQGFRRTADRRKRGLVTNSGVRHVPSSPRRVRERSRPVFMVTWILDSGSTPGAARTDPGFSSSRDLRRDLEDSVFQPIAVPVLRVLAAQAHLGANQ